MYNQGCVFKQLRRMNRILSLNPPGVKIKEDHQEQE